MVDVSIIIVNYNTKELLADCIKSIYDQTFDLSYEIIVVDNASSDGSQEYVKNHFPQVVLVESEVNLGFGLANNLGVKSSKGEFLFFLNSDTVLVENSIKRLCEFYREKHSIMKIGVIGALMIDENRKINGFGSEFPNCKKELRRSISTLPILKKIISTKSEVVYAFEKEYFEIDYVLGADMFMSSKIFRNCGGFSKDFFMYYEESDLQKRLVNSGFRNYILTTTKIIHLEDGSGKKISNYSNKKRIMVHQSKNIYLKKNDIIFFNFYKTIDLLFLILNIFHYKYSFSENVDYFRKIIKTY